jgi:hypothetical protein
MRRMLADGGSRKAEHPLCIGIAVRQPTLDQPVEHPIQRDAIESQIAERLLDVVMSQRRRRSMQQPQDTDPRRRGARARPANQQRSGFSLRRRSRQTFLTSQSCCEFKHSTMHMQQQLQPDGRYRCRGNKTMRSDRGVRFPCLQTTIAQTSFRSRVGENCNCTDLGNCSSAFRPKPERLSWLRMPGTTADGTSVSQGHILFRTAGSQSVGVDRPSHRQPAAPDWRPLVVTGDISWIVVNH